MTTVISVGSGKGGVGKTVIATNLAVSLARNGWRVVLVDLDICGADAHAQLGILNPERTLTDFITRRVADLEAVARPLPSHAGVRFVPGTGHSLATANMTWATKQRILRFMRQLDTDIVVADVGAGTSFHALDYFLAGDQQLLITTPDSAAIVDLQRFVQLAATREVLRRYKSSSPVAKAIRAGEFQTLDAVLDAVREADDVDADATARFMADFCPSLVVNRATDDRRLRRLMVAKLVRQFLGARVGNVYEVPEDPSIAAAERAYLPVVTSVPDAPASIAIAALGESLWPAPVEVEARLRGATEGSAVSA